jgi:hypothetical protein
VAAAVEDLDLGCSWARDPPREVPSISSQRLYRADDAKGVSQLGCCATGVQVGVTQWSPAGGCGSDVAATGRAAQIGGRESGVSVVGGSIGGGVRGSWCRLGCRAGGGCGAYRSSGARRRGSGANWRMGSRDESDWDQGAGPAGPGAGGAGGAAGERNAQDERIRDAVAVQRQVHRPGVLRDPNLVLVAGPAGLPQLKIGQLGTGSAGLGVGRESLRFRFR